MKVFISSLISEMEPVRAAAREVVTTFRHEAIMAEDFSAQPNSPQVACLTGLRQSDLVVLILGERYGAVQPSGLSATHEEYRDAKGRKPIIAFVQESGDREPQEVEFIREVQGWEGGYFRGGFKNTADLTVALTRALYDYALANAAGPVDEQELIERATALLPPERSGYSGPATLNLVVAGAPRQTILRPVELEKPSLADALHQAALFGELRILDSTRGVQRQIDVNTLKLDQERGEHQILINEQGSVRVTLPVRERRNDIPQLIEEVVAKQLSAALAYVAWVLEQVDSTQRLTQVAVAVSISNADYMGWRTQRESSENPNRMTIPLRAFGSGGRSSIALTKARAALRLDRSHIVEDLTVLLRRQWQ